MFLAPTQDEAERKLPGVVATVMCYVLPVAGGSRMDNSSVDSLGGMSLTGGAVGAKGADDRSNGTVWASGGVIDRVDHDLERSHTHDLNLALRSEDEESQWRGRDSGRDGSDVVSSPMRASFETSMGDPDI